MVARRPLEFNFVLRQFGAGVLYGLLLYLGDYFFEGKSAVGYFEPASGVALAILLSGGTKYFWSLLLGGLIGRLYAGDALSESIAMLSGDMVEALLGTWLLTLNSSFDRHLRAFSDLKKLVLYGAIYGVVFGSFVACGTLLLTGNIQARNFFEELYVWWMSDSLGIILVTPLLLTFGQLKSDWTDKKHAVSAIFLLAVTILACQAIFLGLGKEISNLAHGYQIFLFITMIALWLGPFETALALLITAGYGLYGAIEGIGYFAHDVAETHLVNYWIYVVTLSLTEMALAFHLSESKLIKCALEQERDKIQSFLQNASDGVHILDSNGNVIEASTSFCQMLGYTRTEVIGMHVAEWDAKFVGKELTEAIDKVYSSTIRTQFETLHKRKDGSIFEVEVSTSVLSMGGGKVLFCSSRDITERNQTSAALKASAEKYRGIFDESVVAIYIFDSNKNFIDANLAGLALLGYIREELLRMSIPDVDVDPVVVLPAHQQLLTGERIVNYEHRLRCKDGHVVTVLNNSSPLRDAHGNTIGMLSTLLDITDREQALRALREESEKNLVLLRNASDGIHILDAEGNVLEASDSFCAMLGYTRNEVIGMNVTRWDAYFSPEKCLAVVKQQFEHPVRALFETRHRRKDGTEFDVEVSGYPLELNGQPVLFNSSRDITERRISEKMLAEREQYQRALLDGFPFLVWLKNEKGQFLSVNQPFAAACGVATPAQLTGKSDLDIWPTDLAVSYQADDLEVLKSGVPKSVEEPVEINGQRIWFETYKSPVTMEGKVIGTIGFSRDITERKLDEELVRESTLKFRLLSEYAADAIFVADAQGRYVYTNQRANDLLGYKGNELLMMSIGDITPEEDAGHSARMFTELLRDGHMKTELWLLRKDGKRVPVEINAIMLPDGTAYGACRDITERKYLEAEQLRLRGQLQQAQKMEAIGQLTGGIAHDFNNILAAVLGYTGLALERFVPDKESKLASYLHEVQIAGNRARELVAKMLAFSRNTKGEPVALDAAPLVKEIIKTLRSIIPSTIDLESDIDSQPPAILCDPVQLHQVVMNLAINARDAIGERGRITIRLHHVGYLQQICTSCLQDASDDFVEISVADSGHGISPEIQQRIFDPFFTTKEVGKGTGMGLSMVHGIMHEHGGHIVVESKIGIGTTIRLLFPVVHDVHLEQATKIGLAEAMDAPFAARILVVDDEPTVGHMLGEALEAHGYSASVLANSIQALAAFEVDPEYWDIVITDQTMPGISGAELSQKMLALRPDLPIFLCTGYSNSIDEESARALGIRSYFQKPVSISILLKQISAALKHTKNLSV